MSVPPDPKRSSTKQIMIPATDLPVAGLPSMGSNIRSIAASLCDRRHESSEMSFVTYTCVEHVLFQIGHTFGLSTTHNNIGELVWESYYNYEELVQNVPPASRSISHAVCRFLHSRSNVRRMTCFWWQLTHNITTHTVRLSLKEGCLKIFEKMLQFLPLPCGNSPENQVLWKQANLSADMPFV